MEMAIQIFAFFSSTDCFCCHDRPMYQSRFSVDASNMRLPVIVSEDSFWNGGESGTILECVASRGPVTVSPYLLFPWWLIHISGGVYSRYNTSNGHHRLTAKWLHWMYHPERTLWSSNGRELECHETSGNILAEQSSLLLSTSHKKSVIFF